MNTNIELVQKIQLTITIHKNMNRIHNLIPHIEIRNPNETRMT